jgi:ABC-type dipeptide/oligopeptide/nickel transport system permease component
MEVGRRRGRQLGLVFFGLSCAAFFFLSASAASPATTTTTGRQLLDEQQSETRTSLSLLLMVAVLVVSFLCAYLIRDFGVTVVHESGVALLLGMCVGLAVTSIRTVEELQNLIHFDQASFFLFLLPPIIFARYESARNDYARNV